MNQLGGADGGCRQGSEEKQESKTSVRKSRRYSCQSGQARAEGPGERKKPRGALLLGPEEFGKRNNESREKHQKRIDLPPWTNGRPKKALERMERSQGEGVLDWLCPKKREV